ncbi:ShlB/FhaC/HecB family hemolysin secretion/activation protein [Glaciimonas sp. GG7]
MKKYLVFTNASLSRRMFAPRILLLLSGAFFTAANASQRAQEEAQVIQTPASEEQRRRTQAEAFARQRALQAPNVDLGPASTDTPDAADTLALPTDAECFTVQQFVLDVPTQLPPANQAAGASALPFDPFHFVLDYLHNYAGACIGKEGLNVIVARLGKLILRHGYTTSRIGIPAQDLASGTVTLILVPGLIRAIRFADPTLYGTWKNAFPTGPGRLLNLRDLEQGLEQMKRIPSQDVDMQLVPEDILGESDIVLDVKRGKPWKLSANIDDSGAQGTGKLQTSLNFSIDNPLGLNDLFNVGINSDADRKGDQRGTNGNNLYYAIPAGYWRYTVSASNYRYHQKIGSADPFVSSGKSRNLEVTVSQLFQRDQSQKNSWQFKVAKRWSRGYINGHETDNQKRNTTFAELAWVHKHYFGNAQLDVTFANRWGVSWFNGQGDPDPAFDSRNPSGDTFRYSLQSLDATVVVPFAIATQPLTYIGTLRAQNTRSKLYLSDQFTIGNRYTVRGFDGELNLASERGFFLRNELNIPLAQSGQSAYVGIDIGKVYGPSVKDLLGDKLAGATVGLRGGYQGVSYDIFSSWTLYKPERFRTANPTIGFNLNYQY